MGFWGYRGYRAPAGKTYFWRYTPPDPEVALKYWHWDLMGPVPFSYNVCSGVAGDAYPADFVEFGFQSRLIIATIRDAPAIISFTYDGVTEQPERRFEIGFARLEAARGFKIRNAEAGRPCRYQIIPMI